MKDKVKHIQEEVLKILLINQKNLKMFYMISIKVLKKIYKKSIKFKNNINVIKRKILII
jgi:hypothetical protein